MALLNPGPPEPELVGSSLPPVDSSGGHFLTLGRMNDVVENSQRESLGVFLFQWLLWKRVFGPYKYVHRGLLGINWPTISSTYGSCSPKGAGLLSRARKGSKSD